MNNSKEPPVMLHRQVLIVLLVTGAIGCPRAGFAERQATARADLTAIRSRDGARADVARPTAPVPAPREDRGLELFRTQVRPILVERCLDCHGGRKTKHGFDVKTREALLRGGKHGASVIAGDARASKLVAQLEFRRDPDMPPKRPLTPAQIQAVAAWIDLGALYDAPIEYRR